MRAPLTFPTLASLAASVVLLPALLAACGPSTRVVLAPHPENPDSVRQLMRGGARLGCKVPEAYARTGITMVCKEGSVSLGKRTEENRRAPGHPLQITCTGALAERCEPFYGELYKAGAAPCADDEIVPGCGALQCAPPDDAPDACDKMTREN